MNKRILLFIFIGSAPFSLFGMRKVKKGLEKLGIIKPKELDPSFLLRLPLELRAETIRFHLSDILQQYEKGLAPREMRTKSVLIELDALLNLLEPIIAQEALATPSVFDAIVSAFKEVYPSLERTYITTEMAEKFKQYPYFTKMFTKWVEEGAGQKGLTPDEEIALGGIPQYLEAYLLGGPARGYTVAKDFGFVQSALELFVKFTIKKPVSMAYVEGIINLLKPYFPDYPAVGLADALKKAFPKSEYANFNKALDKWLEDQRKKLETVVIPQK